MTDLQIFNNDRFGQVRIIPVDGELMFVAKDVCDCLEITKHRDAISRLDSDERGSVKLDTPGGKQDIAAINEYGLYSLVLSSRKPEAKDFKRWITHDVITTKWTQKGRLEIHSILTKLNIHAVCEDVA